MTLIKIICTSRAFGGDTAEMKSVNALAGKGLEGDRYCKAAAEPSEQITLIESEVIDRLNEATESAFPYTAFRRNLITEGIRLNDLVGQTFYVGKVLLRGHKLCEPCRSLQENLNISDLVTRLTHKGGLRCEILKGGQISTGDQIRI